MINVAAPVAMLVGRGKGPALVVAGLLIAVWLATKAKDRQVSQ